MKKARDAQLRKEVKSLRKGSDVRQKLEAKLERVLADIGWICGWRNERLVVAPVARRSSRQRVMLARAGVANEARPIDFDSVEAKLIACEKSTHLQTEQSQGGPCAADLVLDAQEEIAYQLNNVSNIAQGFADPHLRSVGQRFAKDKAAHWFR